nr:bifunctional 2-polyprenyl-6-hydroxyphenol methylase/3-demethylubiquinol 3-O-methyltransferase UbiG [Rhodococcus rhodnii]
MGIDNDVYNRKGHTWWDSGNPLSFLHGSLGTGRFDYFASVLAQWWGDDATGRSAVDVGCGGGFLAERFAELGLGVVGVDPSEVALAAARDHAAGAGLEIDYRVGSGEALPVEDASADLVYCCDVLEHVDDVDAVLSETARVLRPGGLYVFDTINRTAVSWVVAIKIMQEWRLTRMFDTPIHDWSMCIRPGELTTLMHAHGIRSREIVGLGAAFEEPVARRGHGAGGAGPVAVRGGQPAARLRAGELDRDLVHGYGVKE